ncbi:MAG: hypothetical protein O3A47_11125 [Chloroflexi bacterium]|nr:hypothetical protein [Chloroflexota bacterium]
MLNILLRTVFAFVVGVLSLLGGHRLYLLWRDRDLDIRREIQEAVSDLRRETESRLEEPIAKARSISRPQASPVSPAADTPRNQVDMPKTETSTRVDGPAGPTVDPEPAPTARQESILDRRSADPPVAEVQAQPSLADILQRLNRARETCAQEE